MKIIYKQLFIIGLSSVALSCGTPKKVYTPAKKTTSTTNIPQKTTSNLQTLPEKGNNASKVQHENNEDYFRTNIGDVSKNDNTISYGSIVSAKPNGFKVVKTYFPATGQNFRQRYIILHYTALNNDKSVQVLTQQGVSSHYLVNDLDDKEIYQLVDENKRAYHAGISQWRNDSQLNDTSIGIEIVNMGYVVDSLKRKIFPIYPEYQVEKIAALVKDLANRYNIPATNILAHSDIAPARKQDPGPQFPWKKLYDEHQIGMWYEESAKQNFMNQASAMSFSTLILESSFIYKLQSDLKKFGYGVIPSGTMDDTTKKTIEAFQYHFRPANYDGVLDAETWAILQALIQKYPQK